MAIVVKQEIDCSQGPAPECSTAWSAIDDDDGQQRSGRFCQIFIKEEVQVKQEADGSLEELNCSTEKSESEIWPICNMATEVDGLNSDNAHSISAVAKCNKTSVAWEKTKLYSCARCSYTTMRYHNMKIHVRTHTGEKPFSCVFCDYKSAQSSNLKRHIRKHTGEKSFSCEFCYYNCSNSSDLKKHVRTHTGEKPFRCEFCDFKCAQSGNLKKHFETHTDEKPFNCEFCNFK